MSDIENQDKNEFNEINKNVEEVNNKDNKDNKDNKGNFEKKPSSFNKNYKRTSDYKKNDYRDGDEKFEESDGKRRIYLRKKICRFCHDKSLVIDYKNFDILRRFTTEGGKIIPRRITGNCAKHQRMIASAIKRARYISLLPYLKK